MPATNILYCKAEGCYTTIYDIFGKKITISKPLKEIETQLKKFSIFFRIHKSYLVNISYINTYANGHKRIVTLKDNTELPVAYRRTHLFIRYYANIFREKIKFLVKK
jgi:two-component system LytT family response regulator